MLLDAIYNFIPVCISFFLKILYGLYAVLVIISIVKSNKDKEPELPVVGKIATFIFSKK